MKSYTPRRTNEPEYDYALRQWRYCTGRVDHCYWLQSARRMTGNMGAAIFYQLMARTWQQRANYFHTILTQEFMPGTKVRFDEVFHEPRDMVALFRTIPLSRRRARAERLADNLLRASNHRLIDGPLVSADDRRLWDRANVEAGYMSQANYVALYGSSDLVGDDDVITFRRPSLETCPLCNSSNGHSLSCVKIQRDHIDHKRADVIPFKR